MYHCLSHSFMEKAYHKGKNKCVGMGKAGKILASNPPDVYNGLETKQTGAALWDGNLN